MKGWCRWESSTPPATTARDLLRPPHGVSRVIARPFVGTPGSWTRTAHRKDISLPPPGPTLLDRLADRHVPRLGIGKVDDLFASRNIVSIHAATNAEGYYLVASALESHAPRPHPGEHPRIRPVVGAPQ